MPFGPEGLYFPLNSSRYHVEAVHIKLQRALNRTRAGTTSGGDWSPGSDLWELMDHFEVQFSDL